MSSPSPARHDAFISYRHVDPDRKWAKWLHKRLERYRTPRALVATGKPKRLNRVFRDEEELQASPDLSATIQTELKAAKHLIVVCSPAAVESKWINAEIECFQTLGQQDRILSVLISGTPETSFPPALLKAPGQTSEIVHEPLAAQLPTGRFDYFGRRQVLLKILAPLLDCRFDDLRRRDEQRQRRRLVIGVGVLVMALLLTVIGMWRFELGRIEELTNYSHDSLVSDPSRSLLLSQLALQRTRRLERITSWLGFSRNDSVRSTLELAIVQSQLRGQFLMPTSPLQAIAWDSANRLIASDYYGNINVLDRDSGKLLSHRKFDNGIQRISVGRNVVALVSGQMSVSGSARIISSANRTRTFYVWNLTPGALKEFPLYAESIGLNQASLSSCGPTNRIAVSNGSVKVWEFRVDAGLNTSQEFPELVQKILGVDPVTNSLSASINALSWNSDCTVLAIGTSLGLDFWQVDTGKISTVQSAQSDASWATQVEPEGFLAVDWNSNGSLVAVGGQDHTVRLIRKDGALQQVLSGHQGPVTVVSWNHNGSQLATAGEDGVVRIWAYPDFSSQFKTLVGFYANQGAYVSALAWSPNDSEIASVGDDKTIRIWNVSDKAQKVTLSGRPGLLYTKEDGRLYVSDRRLTDDELMELAHQRTYRSLSAEECKEYLHSSTCPY